MSAHFVRYHCAPRRALRGATWLSLTPRGKWLYDRSYARWTARYPELAESAKQMFLQGEFGIVESFRFISSEVIDMHQKHT